MAEAWIGSGVETMNHDWEIMTWPRLIREAKTPFRDDAGRPIPPGQVGKYFEYLDESGKWLAVHPDDIRRWDPIRNPRYILSHRTSCRRPEVLPRWSAGGSHV